MAEIERGWSGRATIAQLRQHLADPFSRNAYPLLLNTGLSGLLGVGFWFFAARYYTDPDVGRGSALISTMTFLSGIVAINLTGTLSRFVPQTGQRTGRLVLLCYALSCLAAAALTAGFLLTAGYWGPSFELLRDPITALWFLAAVVLANIFTVQDGVLVGLRGSVWVLAENTFFGILKIVLLVFFAAGFPRDGVFLSWVTAMTLVLLPINGLIFGWLIPRHARATSSTAIPPTLAHVGRFVAGDYLGALFAFGAFFLVPVMVAAHVAPHTFAYFYIAWMAGGLLNLIAGNLAHSLTVEGVYEAPRLAANCRAALSRAVGLLLVAAVLVALAAPYVLRVLGRGYLDAVPLLQILAFAALPRAVVEIWIGALRARNRARELAAVRVASGSLMIALVLAALQLDVLSGALGVLRITAVGGAVLASQVIVALWVLPRLWRFLTGAAAAEGATEPSGPPVPTAPANPPEPGCRRQGRGSPRGCAPALTRPQISRLAAIPTRTWAPLAGVCVLTAAALLMYLLPLGRVDLTGMNGYGLVSVLPTVSLAGVALLTVAFVITVSFPRPHPAILGTQLVGLAGCLYGVSALIEPLPRFPITWVHLGFVEYLGRTGAATPELDGRLSWPGFFALVAFLARESTWADLIPVVKLTPLLSNLLFLLPLALILRNLRASWPAKWFAAWLFLVLNWVAQDYFSPQGFSYWLYLIFLAVLVTWFRPAQTNLASTPDPARGGSRRWWRLPSLFGPGDLPGERPAEPAGSVVRMALLLLVVGVFTATSASHPLTPFIMVAACAGLVVADRCIAKSLPTLLAVILVAWLSYLAVGYWSAHLGELLGGIGDFWGNLSTSVGNRVRGNHEHQMVVYTRIALTVFVFSLAVGGLWRRRRRRIDDRVVLVFLLIPFIVIGLQSYGGEILLRVYLFALPALCVCTAYLFFPETGSTPPRPHRFLAATAATLVLLAGFFVARYGNERYEITRAGELAAVQYLYQQPGPARILFPTDPVGRGATPFIPVGYQEVERVSTAGIPAPVDPTGISGVIEGLQERGPGTYLLTTRSQEAYLELGRNYPPGWGQRFRAALAASPQLQVVVENPDAVGYALRAPAGAAPAGAPPSRQQVVERGTRIGMTPWTPVGVAIVAILLPLLIGRELWRLHLAPNEQGRLRPLTLAAVPLLVGLALVVAERLVLLAG
jgi:O-antigen/teichoic acid export membrane protein